MYESNRESITSKTWDDNVTIEQIKKEYSDVVDLFPALHKYKTEHTIQNLQKICVEIADFCLSIYASTQNEKERQVYYDMLDKLNKR